MRGMQTRFTREEKLELMKQIDQLLRVGMSGKDIAKKIGVSQSFVTKLKKEIKEVSQ